MDKITFSEPLTKGKSAYERIAQLQQIIVNSPNKSHHITVDLTQFRTGMSFVFLLACLPYCALANKKELVLTVDKKTFTLMQKIQVPGTCTDGKETKSNRTGFRLLKAPIDVISLTKDIWQGFPVQTSEELGDALQFNIGEVFNNASGHASASYIIGGWHTKQNGLYCFSCYDTGIGIPESVNRYRKANKYPIIPDIQAVKWAMAKGHSTSLQPGRGLGLDLLRNFSKANDGVIHICSGYTLYVLNKGAENYISLKHPFHGTFFEMDITRDGYNYSFREETK
ncbi:MAG: hypothetical protein FWF85_04645 [Clostridiales bacterium]|jgi:hypothetical protein|nr:hypothetical protein [Clostridiales bacterium]MDR2713592.1 hypothetical protein [Clostridiales bacterium]